MKHTDFMALAGKLWGELAAEDKAPFEAQAEEGKQRYQRELAEWKEHGYYTLPDGTKSGPGKSKSELGGLSDEEDASAADDDSKPRRAVGKGRADKTPKQAGSKPASRAPSASNTPKQSKTRPSAQAATSTVTQPAAK